MMKYRLHTIDMFFFILMILGLAVLFGVALSHSIQSSNREAEMKRIEQRHTTSSHSFFNIYYKDNQKVEEVECDECIYGQTDDKIYFINNNKDTVKVVPKIEVERVTTKDKNKAK